MKLKHFLSAVQGKKNINSGGAVVENKEGVCGLCRKERHNNIPVSYCLRDPGKTKVFLLD